MNETTPTLPRKLQGDIMGTLKRLLIGAVKGLIARETRRRDVSNYQHQSEQRRMLNVHHANFQAPEDNRPESNSFARLSWLTCGSAVKRRLIRLSLWLRAIAPLGSLYSSRLKRLLEIPASSEFS